jgi:hypothetical protein
VSNSGNVDVWLASEVGLDDIYVKGESGASESNIGDFDTVTS